MSKTTSMSELTAIIGHLLGDSETAEMETLFGEQSGDQLRDYVSQLSSLGVNHLSGEPVRLDTLRRQVVDTTQQLAFNNYPTFISNAEYARRVIDEYNSIEDSLDSVLETVPAFINKCESFSKDAKLISKRWREVSLMLLKHPQILEVLEVPQLMDTCVRNGHYEEALQLYSYVQKLNKRYGNSIPLIACIFNDVEMYRESMMNQLLKELNSNIQLPACLKVIGYIRRMDKFSEGELRIKFLTARDSWLQSIISEIPKNNPLVHITKIIETNRVNLFDIVTQYRAIFADHEPIVSSTIRYYGITTTPNERDFNDSSILNSWILYKINQFLHILKTDLNRCANNEFGYYYPIESIIEPCFYFGLSMSRIGADFRPQIIPIINETILNRFVKVVDEGTAKFEASIETLALTSQMVNPSVSLSTESDESQQLERDLQPPTSLLEFPLLAHYCNEMLTAMNEIRQTTPLTLITRFASALNHSFQRVSDAICRYFRAEEYGLSPKGREILHRMCDQYLNELLPHLCKCFERICPQSSIANKLGVSVIELNKVKDSFGKLVIKNIGHPIESLLLEKSQINGKEWNSFTTESLNKV